MYQCTIAAEFAAAHYLKNYHGKCENLHGHNYKVKVSVSGTELDAGGMLLDFGVLKKAVREILSELDHGCLNEHTAFADGNPSAERIAFFIYSRLEPQFPDVDIDRVEVAETERNIAAYIPE